MLLILAFAAFTGLLFLGYRHFEDSNSFEAETGLLIFSWLSTFILALIVIALPFNRNASKVRYLQYIETQKTVNEQRASGMSELERVQLTKIIIDNNNKMVEDQFYSKSIWVSWYYYDKVNELKPIK